MGRFHLRTQLVIGLGIGVLLMASSGRTLAATASLKTDTVSLHINDKGRFVESYVEHEGNRIAITDGGIELYDRDNTLLTAEKVTVTDHNGTVVVASDYASVASEVTYSRGEHGTVTCRWNVSNTTDEQQFIRIAFVCQVNKQSLKLYTGYETINLDSLKQDKIWNTQVAMRFRLPLTSAYNEHVSLGMTIAADEFHSRWSLRAENKDSSARICHSYYIVVDAHDSYEGTFVLLGCSGRYQERSAVATWHALYPEIFQRNADADQRIYGTSASYLAWEFKDAEECRLTGGDWDWCIGPYRRNGDIANSERFYDYTPIRPFKPKDDISREEWLAHMKEKFSHGRWCNVAMAYYFISGTWAESALAAEYFPDARILQEDDHDNDVHRNCWGPAQDDAQAMFSYKTTWGKHLRQSLDTIADTYPITSFALDSPNPQFTYRGPLMDKIKAKAWDQHGAYVANAIAVAHLMDYIRDMTTYNGKRMGAISNINDIPHYLAALHCDTCMIEKNPFAKVPPYPLSHRYIMGDKAVTWWEGYRLEEMIDTTIASPYDLVEAARGLADYTALRSIFAGTMYQHYFSSGVEYMIRLHPLLEEMNDAYWKPVQGFIADNPDLWTARYGEGMGSYLAVCNPTADTATGTYTVYNEEVSLPASAIFAEYYGMDTENSLAGTSTEVRYDVPSRKPRVFVPVMTAACDAPVTARADRSQDFSHLTYSVRIHSDKEQTLDCRIPIDRRHYVLRSVRVDNKAVRIGARGENATCTISLQKDTPLMVDIQYTNIRTDLDQEDILAFETLDQKHTPTFRVLVGSDADDNYHARRLVEFFRNYVATLKYASRVDQRTFDLDVEILSGADLPAHTIALAAIDSEQAEATSAIAEFLSAGTHSNVITGTPTQGMLLITADTADTLRTLTYDYMNLLGSTTHSEWVGDTWIGVPAVKSITISMTDKERSLFGDYYRIAFACMKSAARRPVSETVSKKVKDTRADQVRIVIRPVVKPSENLLHNKKFEFNTSFPGAFVTSVDPKVGHDAPPSYYIHSTTTEASGYWNHKFHVKPGTKYFTSTWIKNRGGKILNWMYGSNGDKRFERRIYLWQGGPSFLEPVFIQPPQRKGNDEWQIIAHAIDIPEQTSRIYFGLGSLFNTGDMWFDDMVFMEGVPPLKVDASYPGGIASVQVYMQSTGDVLYTQRYDPAVPSMSAQIPDTLADQPYRVRVTTADGLTVNKSYPAEQQDYHNMDR